MDQGVEMIGSEISHTSYVLLEEGQGEEIPVEIRNCDYMKGIKVTLLAGTGLFLTGVVSQMISQA